MDEKKYVDVPFREFLIPSPGRPPFEPSNSEDRAPFHALFGEAQQLLGSILHETEPLRLRAFFARTAVMLWRITPPTLDVPVIAAEWERRLGVQADELIAQFGLSAELRPSLLSQLKTDRVSSLIEQYRMKAQHAKRMEALQTVARLRLSTMEADPLGILKERILKLWGQYHQLGQYMQYNIRLEPVYTENEVVELVFFRIVEVCYERLVGN